MSYKNVATVRPDELQPGDVLAVTVTCHIQYDGSLRFYRCDIDAYRADGIPQGGQTKLSDESLANLFPVVTWAELGK